MTTKRETDMTLYIAQQDPHGRTQVWEADDEADAIRLVQTKYERDFDDASEAVAHDKQRSRIEASPADLLTGPNVWPGLHDAVVRFWGVDSETVVDLDDDDEWAPDTPGGARLRRFQADQLSDLDDAEIGRVGDYDVIYLPDADRAAIVSNGDAVWFDARSFQAASLHAQGAWSGEA
jgi:hypothetical protein